MNKGSMPSKQLKSSMESMSRISYSRIKEESLGSNSCMETNFKKNKNGFCDSGVYNKNSQSSTLKMYNSDIDKHGKLWHILVNFKKYQIFLLIF